MMKSGPIIIIEDDEEDQHLCATALGNFVHTNRIRIFGNGIDALTYLQTTSENPFIILCDLQMPRMTGMELREQIFRNERLRKKSIPFIFISGTADREDLLRSYELNVQGFFTKPNTLEEWISRMDSIMRYWSDCLEPGDLKI